MIKPPWHILLIDDCAEDRADMRQMLLRGGDRRYRFSEAQLGAEGVRMALAPKHGPIDCVLLDYALPDMEALDVLAALCQGSGSPPCPVVVITGAEMDEGLHLLSAGAQDYIGKHWSSPQSLTRALENAVERHALQAHHRRTDLALRLSEERYRALFNSIDAGYAVVEVMFDPVGKATDARYLEVNPAFTQQTGLCGVVGQTLRQLMPGIEPEWIDLYGSVALTGAPVRQERQVQALRRWFDVYAFRLGAPQAGQVAVLFTDTIQRMWAELALHKAKAEAEAASCAKSDFLLAMSHELRSPLSSMLGYAQLLEAGKPPPAPAQQDSIEQILRAGWYLLGLINEILDLTVIESGRLSMLSQAMSMDEVLDDGQAMAAPLAQASAIQLHVQSPAPQCRAWADPIRVKQVLINLLTNAIKYNRPGGRVDVCCTANAAGTVRISVRDTGRGLSTSQVEQLFQPFNRLGQEAGSESGTGIGLVICKRLVELMGGRIGVDSEPGVGSCFWFELDPETPLAVNSLDLPVRTLLCVEADAESLQRVEALVAERPDLCLLRAPDIARGIQIARSARPDAILLSARLHDMQATQALQLLAKHPATALIPVITLGTDLQRQDSDASLTTNFSGFLAQPVHQDALALALDLVFQQPAAGQQAAA